MKEGGRLFEAGRLLTFSAFRTGAYSNKYGRTIGQLLQELVSRHVGGK